MSFGFSVGDFLAVGELVFKLYGAFMGATKEYQEIRRELSTLHIILWGLERDADNPDSVLNRRGSDKRDELLDLLDNVRETLEDLEAIINRYRSLAETKKRLWHRIPGLSKAGGGTARDRILFASEDIPTIRNKLLFNISSLNSFKLGLCFDSLARVEGKLDELVQDLRGGGNPAESVISAYSTKDAFSWGQLEKELKAEGISIRDIRLHKATIKEILKILMTCERPESMLPCATSMPFPIGEPDAKSTYDFRSTEEVGAAFYPKKPIRFDLWGAENNIGGATGRPRASVPARTARTGPRTSNRGALPLPPTVESQFSDRRRSLSSASRPILPHNQTVKRKGSTRKNARLRTFSQREWRVDTNPYNGQMQNAWEGGYQELQDSCETLCSPEDEGFFY